MIFFFFAKNFHESIFHFKRKKNERKPLGVNAISEFERRCKIQGTVESQRVAIRTAKKKASDEWATEMNGKSCNKNIRKEVLRVVK